MSEQVQLLQRCRIARDYIFSAKNFGGNNSLFQYCESEAYEIWKNISSKLQTLSYCNSHDFLTDLYELKLLVDKCARNKQHAGHITIIFDRARELAQCKQPLRASVQTKHCTNAYETIIESATSENIPTIISTLFENGQNFGEEVALESKRYKPKIASSSVKGSSKTSIKHIRSASIPKPPPKKSSSSSSMTDTWKTVSRSKSKQSVANRKQRSTLRVYQRPPRPDCFPHAVYYGVWETLLTGAFQAHVNIFGESVSLGQTFQFAHQAAKAVDRAFIRVFGPEHCPPDDLNFDISAYAQEDMVTLSQYDAPLRASLMFCKEWKGLQALDFGFLIRRQMQNEKGEDTKVETQSAVPDAIASSSADVGESHDLDEATSEADTDSPVPAAPRKRHRRSAPHTVDREASLPKKRSRQSARLRGQGAEGEEGEDDDGVNAQDDGEELDHDEDVDSRCNSPFKRAAKLLRSDKIQDCTEGVAASSTIAERLSRHRSGSRHTVPRPYSKPTTQLAMPMKRRRSRNAAELAAEEEEHGVDKDLAEMYHEIVQEAATEGVSRLRSGKTIAKSVYVSEGEGGDDECSALEDGEKSLQQISEERKTPAVSEAVECVGAGGLSQSYGETFLHNASADVELSSKTGVSGNCFEASRSVSGDSDVVETSEAVGARVRTRSSSPRSDGMEDAPIRKKSRRLQGGSVEVQHIFDAFYSGGEENAKKDILARQSKGAPHSSEGKGESPFSEEPSRNAPPRIPKRRTRFSGSAVACEPKEPLLVEPELESNTSARGGRRLLRSSAGGDDEKSLTDRQGHVFLSGTNSSFKTAQREVDRSTKAGPSIEESSRSKRKTRSSAGSSERGVDTSAGEASSNVRVRRSMSEVSPNPPESGIGCGKKKQTTSSGKASLGSSALSKPKQQSSSLTSYSEGTFSYISASYRKHKVKQVRSLCNYIGRTFKDLAVDARDPFRFCRVADVVQVDGKGPFLYKFYNPKKHKSMPPASEDEESWGYQGCNEIFTSPGVYEWV